MTIQRRAFARIAHVARVSKCQSQATVVVFCFSPEIVVNRSSISKRRKNVTLRFWRFFDTECIFVRYLTAYTCSILSYVTVTSPPWRANFSSSEGRRRTNRMCNWIIRWEAKQRRRRVKKIVGKNRILFQSYYLSFFQFVSVQFCNENWITTSTISSVSCE